MLLSFFDKQDLMQIIILTHSFKHLWILGNPLQCSCLENPRDGGAWWAAICGVAQSRTRLKRLSSSQFSYIITLASNNDD